MGATRGLAGQAEPGPAKASRFRDPRTGKFDYWGWLDAGMANLGKGGVLFEDDTPDVNAREGILDKPAAMTAAGAPENSRMPEESHFEARGADQGVNLVRTVAYAAQDGGNDAPADGGGAGPGGNAGQGQAATPGTPAQPQGPDGSGTPGQEQPQPEGAPDYSKLPITQEGWNATPWGQGKKFTENLPTSPKDAPTVDPHAYDYPKVGEPPNTPEGQKIRELIEKYAKQYGVPVQLLYNKAHVETGGTWNTKAVNPNSGAFGLFQIMPGTAEGLKIDNSDLEQHIRGAADLTSRLLKTSKGDPFLAEIGYNARPGHIWSGQPLPYETYYHLQKVFPGQRRDFLWQRMPVKVASNPKRFWEELYK